MNIYDSVTVFTTVCQLTVFGGAKDRENPQKLKTHRVVGEGEICRKQVCWFHTKQKLIENRLKTSHTASWRGNL